MYSVQCEDCKLTCGAGGFSGLSVDRDPNDGMQVVRNTWEELSRPAIAGSLASPSAEPLTCSSRLSAIRAAEAAGQDDLEILKVNSVMQEVLGGRLGGDAQACAPPGQVGHGGLPSQRWTWAPCRQQRA